MFAYRQKYHLVLTVLITAILAVSSQLTLAQGNSNGNANAKANSNGNGHGKNKNIGVGNASNGIMGRIVTEKGIYYSGQSVEIGIRFPRGSELITEGSVDAFVVIFSPVIGNGDTDADVDSGSDSGSDSAATTDPSVDALSDAVVLPVSNVASVDTVKLFEVEAVDVSTLAAGTYQLGLILTDPGGDPLSINDWYTGLLGLIDIRGITITDEAVDFDEDGDGHVDDNPDGNGFSNVTDDDTDSAGGSDSSDTDTSGDT